MRRWLVLIEDAPHRPCHTAAGYARRRTRPTSYIEGKMLAETGHCKQRVSKT